MNGTFDIAAMVSEQTARFFQRTGIAPAICRVSRDIYRALVEQKAAENAIGNLIIATFAATSIVTDTAKLRVVIDEMLSGPEVCVE
jgi:hypothetical protein